MWAAGFLLSCWGYNVTVCLVFLPPWLPPLNEGLHPQIIGQIKLFLPYISLVKYISHSNKKVTNTSIIS